MSDHPDISIRKTEVTIRKVDFKAPGHEWNGVVYLEDGVPITLDFYVWNAGSSEYWHLTMSEDLTKELGQEVWVTAMQSGNGHGSAKLVREKPVVIYNRITMDSEMNPALSALSSMKVRPNVINAHTGKPLAPYAVTGEVLTVTRGSDWVATIQIDSTEDLIHLSPEIERVVKEFYTKKGNVAR